VGGDVEDAVVGEFLLEVGEGESERRSSLERSSQLCMI
jgi:hypothetical protein